MSKLLQWARRHVTDMCQMECDRDCEIGRWHCWNHHRPSHKPDWHDPEACDREHR